MSSRRTENGYYLKKLALAASTDIHLTSEEFKEIVHARLALNEFTHFEEKYYCVCENFRELETTVHDQALNNLIYVVTDAAEFYEAKVNFSRRLLRQQSQFIASTTGFPTGNSKPSASFVCAQGMPRTEK